jgi:hypothetical protein
LSNKGLKKESEKKAKTQRSGQPLTLAYMLIRQTMSSPVSLFFFGVDQLVSFQNDAM